MSRRSPLRPVLVGAALAALLALGTLITISRSGSKEPVRVPQPGSWQVIRWPAVNDLTISLSGLKDGVILSIETLDRVAGAEGQDVEIRLRTPDGKARPLLRVPGQTPVPPVLDVAIRREWLSEGIARLEISAGPHSIWEGRLTLVP